MNNSRKFFWALLALLLAVLITLVLHKRPAPITDVVSAEPTGKSQTNNQISVTPVRNSKTNVPAQINAPVQTSSPQASREEKWRQVALGQNVPIDFWGQVIDQDGNPLAGVNVITDIRTFTIGIDGKPYTAFPKTTLATGADGLFEVRGKTGDVFSILALEKEGYEWDPNGKHDFGYNTVEQFRSAANSPIVFRLWKNGLKQSLVSGDKFATIVPDGRPYAIDLMNGTIAEAKGSEGDLHVWVKRPNDVKRGEKYNWSFIISPQNGSVLQDQNFLFADMTLAPTDGYINNYESVHQSSDTSWTAWELNRRFYVKIHSGQILGRIQIGVDSSADKNGGQAELHVQYVLNPSGSPILR